MADSEDKTDEPSETPEEETSSEADAAEENGSDAEESTSETSDEASESESSSEEADQAADSEDDSDGDPDGDDRSLEASGEDESSTTDTDSDSEEEEEDEQRADESASEEDDETDTSEQPDDETDESSSNGTDEPELDGTEGRLLETLQQRRPDADRERLESIAEEAEQLERRVDFDELVSAAVLAVDADLGLGEVFGTDASQTRSEAGVAAFFDHPDRLLAAARHTRDSKFDDFETYSPFPIHGMDEAMGLERSWMPWVTFFAGLTGFLCAIALQFGTMTFDWPIIIGGKPYAPWPAFVPVMFELTVLIGGVTTGVVMLKAAGCFQPADVLDPDITDDRFALWIGDEDDSERSEVVAFVEQMDPVEIRTFTEQS